MNETAAHETAPRETIVTETPAYETAADTTIATMPPGPAAVVCAVPSEHEASLARVGIGLGSVVAVESRAPFGGPIVVRVGHARIALARSVAASVLVERPGS